MEKEEIYEILSDILDDYIEFEINEETLVEELDLDYQDSCEISLDISDIFIIDFQDEIEEYESIEDLIKEIERLINE